MEVMAKSLLYHKQPLSRRGRPYFNDGKWSLPQQKQLIPRMKKRTLNPLKLKQIYELKIRDQALLERHQKTENSCPQALEPILDQSVRVNSEPKQFRPRAFNIRVREKSIGNVLFKRMGERARYDMSYMQSNNNSWLRAL